MRFTFMSRLLRIFFLGLLASLGAVFVFSCSVVIPDYTYYTYKVVNTYPHDRDAFTQGLVFENGVLYEGTGLL